MIQDYRSTCELEPSNIREFLGREGIHAELLGNINMNVPVKQAEAELKKSEDIVIFGVANTDGYFVVTPEYLDTVFKVGKKHASQSMHRLQKGELTIDSEGKFLLTFKSWLLKY